VPAATTSFLTGWGVYLLAAAALFSTLGVPVGGAVRAEYTQSATDLAAGAAQVIDRLSPGVAVSLELLGPQSAGTIVFTGTVIHAFSGTGDASSNCEYRVQNVTVYPGEKITLREIDGTIMVTSDG
jgi:hypothetical protein